ncbi:MAG: hypothetical protein COT91_04345 [Candidatus Doudnabacteria bacterium CG10_big_fil_rev_8_21_14_0_10_41_10]|uniref:Uncharacterized protein n=1 Tax=Candidatus Doudnabacteria bacterium CG10_big_fil_rev_8_21_14_0_10_41_10 TaxID=1974551 RepID=A0A2H0VCN2_9BACT|nr:MAG: hypothetical protein COT91_04345 [Candidatus Doudnabacteria bacterium CG10_big_fil_rev_8_21_14_0_10_41_10]
MLKKIFQKNIFRNLLLGFCLAMVIAVALLPSTALAIDLEPVKSLADRFKLAKYQTFSEIFTAILKALLSLAFIVAIIFVVLAGYSMVVSRGNEEKVTKAKQSLLWAVIGMIVIVASWIIISIVVETVKTGNVGVPGP